MYEHRSGLRGSAPPPVKYLLNKAKKDKKAKIRGKSTISDRFSPASGIK